MNQYFTKDIWMAKKHAWKRAQCLLIKETQIKTIMTPVIPTRRANIKKTNYTKCCKDVEQLELNFLCVFLLPFYCAYNCFEIFYSNFF